MWGGGVLGGGGIGAGLDEWPADTIILLLKRPQNATNGAKINQRPTRQNHSAKIPGIRDAEDTEDFRRKNRLRDRKKIKTINGPFKMAPYKISDYPQNL